MSHARKHPLHWGAFYIRSKAYQVVRYNVWVKHKPFYLHDKHVALRLLIALGLFMVCVVVFAKLAWDVRERETLSFDTSLLTAIHTLSTPWLDTVARTATQFGGSLFVPIVTLVITGWLWLKRYRNHALLIFVGVGGASVLSLALKAFFARTRPELWQHLVHETSFSFPSGHELASAALAASIVAALWFTRWRTVAIVVGALYVASIGFTRLYLGVHYPTDILAGWLVAVAWVAAVAVIFLTSPLSLKKPKTD